MKRDRLLNIIRMAGYHNDKEKFVRLYCENRIQYSIAIAEFNKGLAIKKSLELCSCHVCLEEHNA